MHRFRTTVSFGDCDPAGIVFYPNIFRWMDQAFHDYLRGFGGHASICNDLGAIGIGVMDANARFLTPLHDGDALEIYVSLRETRRKSVILRYVGQVGTHVTFEGTEMRAVFFKSEKGLRAGTTASLVSTLRDSHDSTKNVDP